MHSQTKIGATLGPASATAEIITAMVKAGVNFFRLNFSHGAYEDHARLIAMVRAVEKSTGEPLPILQDLQGPKMRLGTLPKEGVEIHDGSTVQFDTSLGEVAEGVLPITYPGLQTFLKVGERILIDDGRLEVTITSITGSVINTTVVEGGVASSHKGLNLPDSTLLSIPALSDKDKADVKFAIEQGIEIISLSFAKRPEDIIELKNLIERYQVELGIKPDRPVYVVGKIERPEAVQNLESIIKLVDAVMVARGDLGLELPGAQLAIVQKQIIRAANAAGKPVIVATQMLDSMQHSRRPTRAEITDVSNAVIDQADALLLTNETAMGEYPTLTVETMHDIILATEATPLDDAPLPSPHVDGTTVTKATTEVTRLLVEETKAKAIVTLSYSGETARLISQARPRVPIVVGTTSERVRRQLNLSWGVRSFSVSECRSVSELITATTLYLKTKNLAALGDKIIVAASDPLGVEGVVNLVEVKEVL